MCVMVKGSFPSTSKHPLAGHGFDSAQVREDQEAVVGWLLHKVLLLVPRSPTPRTNCSSRPPMAPEGLGAAARSPTVLLYAAKKAERTSCSRVSRSLRAVSLQLVSTGGYELILKVATTIQHLKFIQSMSGAVVGRELKVLRQPQSRSRSCSPGHRRLPAI